MVTFTLESTKFTVVKNSVCESRESIKRMNVLVHTSNRINVGIVKSRLFTLCEVLVVRSSVFTLQSFTYTVVLAVVKIRMYFFH